VPATIFARTKQWRCRSGALPYLNPRRWPGAVIEAPSREYAAALVDSEYTRLDRGIAHFREHSTDLAIADQNDSTDPANVSYPSGLHPTETPDLSDRAKTFEVHLTFPWGR